MVGLELLFMDDGRPVRRVTRFARAGLALTLPAVLLALVVYEARRAADLRRRPTVPCVVTASGVDSVGASPYRNHPYRAWVAFAFEYQGYRQTGRRLTADAHDPGTDDAAEAYAHAAALSPGTRGTCHVDTTNLSESVWARPPQWWEAWGPPLCLAAFVAVGALYAGPQVRLAFAPPGSPSPQGRRLATRALGGLMFAGAGAAVVLWWGLPVARTVGSQRWPAVPCVVEASQLQSDEVHGEVSFTTYRTDVLYRYAVNGRTYHSNCYSPTECASPFRAGRSDAIANYMPGRPTICYVDPDDPTVATLSRRLSPTVAFAAAPLLLALLGGLLLVDGGDGGPAGRAVNRLMRRRPWSLLTVAVAVVACTVWGLVGRP